MQPRGERCRIAPQPRAVPGELLIMKRNMIYIGMIFGGWAGDYIGLRLKGTFLASTAGSFAGVFVVWWIVEDHLEW